MSEQVNINVNETNENINITSTEIVEVIDINVGETIEEVTLNITEEVIQVNINKVTGGGGNQNLQEVTDNGNTTTNDISLLNSSVLLDNGSRLKKGTTDAGNGGNKGIALKCSLDYELKWEAGRKYIMEQDGITIREVSYNFTNIPTASDDNTKGFVVDSRWILDNGDVYVCTDATTSNAVWELQIKQVNSDWNATSGVAEILNKPFIPTNTSDLTNDSNFVSDANYVHTDNNFTNTLKTKLDGIADGAEVNVNADWNATSGDALILNKPTSLPPNGSASGDLQGSYPNPTVHQIQGQPVQNGNPANGDVLIWDNSQWKHQKVKTTDIQDNDGLHLITTAQQTIINNTSGTNTGDNAVNSLYSGLATSKQDTLVSGTNIKTIEGQSILGSGNIDLTKTDVGLGNVDNTSDLNKPISTATQTALDLKVDKVTGSRLITSAESTLLGNTSGTNTGDETGSSIRTKLGITTLSGSNTGDETTATIKTKLGAASTSADGYLTSTDWNTFNRQSYAINFGSALGSLSSSTQYYFGMPQVTATTGAAARRLYIPKSGIIKSCIIYARCTIASSSESWTINIRLNNTTNTTVASVGNTSQDKVFSNTSLNISVVAGDYIELATVTPAWVTNPGSLNFYGTLTIE